MSYKRYKLFIAIIAIILVGLVGWAIVRGNALIPAPAIIAASVIFYLLSRHVKEVTVDERVYSIAEKASLIAFRTFGIATAVIGATLVAIGWDSSSDLYLIGLTLAYSACVLILTYYIAYIYYNRKYSGKK